MNAYLPSDPGVVAAVAIVLALVLLSGFLLQRRRPDVTGRVLAWIVTVGATVVVERATASEPAGVRMVAIIAALLWSMKAVVAIEARRSGMSPLPVMPWLGFAALWPGMRPKPFADAGGPPRPGALALGLLGIRHAVEGAALVGAAWWIWHRGRAEVGDELALALATVLLLPGISLILHFGIFNVATAAWRGLGVDVRPLFRAPLKARTLDAFWSRRWNLAFSEMTSLGIYRPLSRVTGRGPAILAAFVASGLLHELAISVPVLDRFGWPMLYFILHGTLILVERRLEAAGRPVHSWGAWSHVWVIGWLAAPMFILFHRPFLKGVVWPLIGIQLGP